MQNYPRYGSNSRRRGVVAMLGAVLVASFGFVGTSASPASAVMDTVTSLTPANPSEYSYSVISTSCPSADFCLAVGRAKGSGMADPAYPYLSAWNGSSWSLVPSSGWPSPFDIKEVSCGSSTFCVIVGSAFESDGQGGYAQNPAAFVWNGTSVTRATLPAGGRSFFAVSCGSVQFCLAVGETNENPTRSLVMKWNGSAWSTETASVFATAGQFQKMRDIDCDVSGRCVGITVSDENGTPTGQILDRNGTTGTWSAPTGRTDPARVRFFSVDCQPGELGRCVALSFAPDGNGYSTNRAVLYDLGSGAPETRWTNITLPVIATSIPNTPNAVSAAAMTCVSATDCLLVGSSAVAAGSSASLVMRLSGTTWTELPSTSGTGRTYFSSLSCPTTAQCMGVGWQSDPCCMMKDSAMAWSIRDSAAAATTTAPATTVPAPTTTVAASSQTTAPAATVPAATVAPVTTAVPVLQRAASSVAPAVAPPAVSTVRALPAASTPIVADASIVKGEKVKVSFGGFTPFEYVQLIVASTPRVIGSGYADSRGFVSLEGDLPTTLASGSHTLAVYAPASGKGYRQPIVVSAASLPSTGTNLLDGTVPAALLLLSLGGFLLVSARHGTASRRRRFVGWPERVSR